MPSVASAVALTPSLRLALMDALAPAQAPTAPRGQPSDVLGLAIFFLWLGVYLVH